MGAWLCVIGRAARGLQARGPRQVDAVHRAFRADPGKLGISAFLEESRRALSFANSSVAMKPTVALGLVLAGLLAVLSLGFHARATAAHAEPLQRDVPQRALSTDRGTASHDLHVAALGVGLWGLEAVLLDAVRVPMVQGATRFGMGYGAAPESQVEWARPVSDVHAPARPLPPALEDRYVDAEIEVDTLGQVGGRHVFTLDVGRGVSARLGPHGQAWTGIDTTAVAAVLAVGEPMIVSSPHHPDLAWLVVVQPRGSAAFDGGRVDDWRNAFEALGGLDPVAHARAAQRAIEAVGGPRNLAALPGAGTAWQRRALMAFLTSSPEAMARALQQVRQDPGLAERLREVSGAESTLAHKDPTGEFLLGWAGGDIREWRGANARSDPFKVVCMAEDPRIVDQAAAWARDPYSLQELEGFARRHWEAGASAAGREAYAALREDALARAGLRRFTLRSRWIHGAVIWGVPVLALLLVLVRRRSESDRRPWPMLALMLVPIVSMIEFGGVSASLVAAPLWVLVGVWQVAYGGAPGPAARVFQRPLLWIAVATAVLTGLASLEAVSLSEPIAVALSLGPWFGWLLAGVWIGDRKQRARGAWSAETLFVIGMLVMLVGFIARALDADGLGSLCVVMLAVGAVCCVSSCWPAPERGDEPRRLEPAAVS